MATPTTYNTDTELSSVNSILGAIGQSPVTTIFANVGEVNAVNITPPTADIPVTLVGTPVILSTTSNSVGSGLRIELTVIDATDKTFRFKILKPGKKYQVNDEVTFLDADFSGWLVTIASLKQSDIFVNPEVAFVYGLLMESNQDVQNEGWVFNRENHYPLTPNADGEIVFPSNILRLDMFDNAIYRTTNVVRRDGKLYDKLRHTYEFTDTIHADIVWLFPFEDLPSVFKRYITIRASVRAATQMVTNRELAQMLAMQEGISRAACMEYECNQGDYSMFGTPEGTTYRPYQPYHTLFR